MNHGVYVCDDCGSVFELRDNLMIHRHYTGHVTYHRHGYIEEKK